MAGPLKTLYGALQSSSFLSGISLVFGDEEIQQNRFGLPAIVMVPKGGSYDPAPGYAANTDPNTELLWEVAEQVEFWIYNASTTTGAQGGIDHADAIEGTRQLLLSALRDQQAQYTDVANVAFGLSWKVTAGRWETFANAPSRYGRAYVLSTIVKITIPMAQNPNSPIATILTEQISTTVTNKPS